MPDQQPESNTDHATFVRNMKSHVLALDSAFNQHCKAIDESIIKIPSTVKDSIAKMKQELGAVNDRIQGHHIVHSPTSQTSAKPTTSPGKDGPKAEISETERLQAQHKVDAGTTANVPPRPQQTNVPSQPRTP